MLFSLTSRVICSLAAFIYPGYASYKTLSQRPASEADLERWLMYWSVLGCVVGVEYLAEWLVSWIPFYSTFKAIFLLYLVLPQTQGATYLYSVHLRPFFASHERQIDQTIAEVRVRLYRFLQEKARAVWAAVLNALAPGSAAAAAANEPAPAGTHAGGRPQDNAPTGPSQLLSSLWTSYGPGIVAGGAALLRQTAAATLPGANANPIRPSAAAGSANALNTPPGSTFNGAGSVDPAERRRQLEAELASLSSISMPPANNPARPSPSSSDSSSGMRERTTSGKFEEIQKNDVEGYELDEDERFVGGFVPSPAGSSSKGRNTGWFSGWGAGGSSERGSYQRVKDD